MEISKIKLAIFFIKLLLTNPKVSIIVIQSFFVKRLRLSFAYLYRIEHKGKFLLIKGNRIKNQFQPVGGVYKYEEGARDFLHRINYEDDRTSYNGDLENDLRIFITGYKLIEFLFWFNLGDNRETNFRREFKEELIETNILNYDNLDTLELKKMKSHYSFIHKSPHFNCFELLFADIIRPKFDSKGKESIVDLFDKGNSKIKWVTEDQIKHLGYDKSTGESEIKISKNSKWLLN